MAHCPATTSIMKDKRGLIEKTAAVLFALALWQAGAMWLQSELLLVSPVTVAGRLCALILEPGFWSAVAFSLVRIAAGFLLSFAVGILLGAYASRFHLVEVLLWPFIAAIKATPVASFIILCLIWLTSTNLSVFISFLMVLPIVYTNVLTGLKNTDKGLLEMGNLFRVSRLKKLWYIVLPGLRPYLISACSVGLGLSWKAGVAAEIIGIPKGSMGEKLYEAKIYLNSPDLFSWTVTIVLVSILFEKLFLSLLKALLRCRPKTAKAKEAMPLPEYGPLQEMELQGLSKSFGTTPVFRKLRHRFGSLTCIMGPSGCGKTTLLRVLMGLEKPDSGNISGTPATVAPVFQEDRLCEDFSALENLTLVRGVTAQAAEKALLAVGIESGDKPVREFSGGMKRRVALLRALLSPGELLIMDEPFKGLDEETKASVLQFLLQNRRGRRLILATHAKEEAAALGGTIWEMPIAQEESGQREGSG